MTANELADAIEKGGKDGFFQDEIIAILRQQQAEIESLKLRELTEWEIKECWEEATEMREHFCSQYFDFAQLILKKASEK
jgi:hypothetical protein